MSKASNEFGQAAVNNTNGFGSAAGTNSVGWGSIHPTTYGHPITNLVGLSSQALSYLQKVLSDGGDVDSPRCLNAQFQSIGL